VERLTGIGASPGVAFGPALVAAQRDHAVRFTIPRGRIAQELEAFTRARARSKEQLTLIRSRMVAARAGELVSLFDAQRLMLDDPLFVERVEALIQGTQANAEWAIHEAAAEVAGILDEAADPYLRERKGDLHDVAGRVRMNLREDSGGLRRLMHQLDRPCVLIADELTPSMVAQLDWTRLAGFATEAGSRTYHTAIMARSLGVPAVVGLGDLTGRVRPGVLVLLDGETGAVTIEPDEAAQHAEGLTRRRPAPRRTSPAGPLRTRDGLSIRLMANVDRLEDVELALGAGAEGVGLFRSESLLADVGLDLADEECQYHAYRRLVEAAHGSPVTIRTFDIDGRHAELTTAFTQAGTGRWGGQGGLRGIRAGLAAPDVLAVQLRAILRAGAVGPVRVMFPFVSSVEEVRAARAIMERVRASLPGDGGVVPVPVGVMIELPAAALMAAALAREADFLMIGTNDLIQYTLGVDRTDERVSDRYQPLHPAVLRLIRLVHRAGTRANVPVAVCGEMAADPVLLPVLVGCGLTTFSMTPGALEMARVVVGETDARYAKRVAARMRRLGTIDEIEEYLRETLGLAHGRETAGTAKE